MFKRLLSIVLSVQMICLLAAAAPAATFAAEDTPSQSTSSTPLTDGTFVPGEVIVMFRPGAVKDAGISLNTAKELDNVDENFGETMKATGDAKEAARDAKSEAAILRDILGDDFVIMDSIAFDDDLSIALVRSEIYETADMMNLHPHAVLSRILWRWYQSPIGL